MNSAARAPLGIHLRIAVFRRDGYRCQHCGLIGTREQLEVDHVAPFSRGGPDSFHNLQTLCRPCNRRKGARLCA